MNTREKRQQAFRSRVNHATEQLTEVDRKILRALLRYPFQRAEDLSLATSLSIATVYRHLNRQVQLKIIEKVSSSVLGTASCWLYHLSNLGLYVLAADEQADPAILARRWRADEAGLLRLLPRLARVMSVQDCINGLVAHAPVALAQQGHQATVRWHWMRDYRYHFSYRERGMSCSSDAYLVLRLRGVSEDGTFSNERDWYSLFLFLDAGISQRRQVSQRLQRLLCYRECAERWPLYRHFPCVLVCVGDPHARELWQRAAREAATSLRCAPLVGAIAALPEPGTGSPFPQMWRLAWRTLGTNVSCQLSSLLAPLPGNALPPSVLDEDIASDDGAEEQVNQQQEHLSCPVPATLSKVIAGGFAHCATQSGKEDNKDWDERERMGFLGLAMSQRHLQLLTFLLKYPLLSAGELAIFLQVQTNSLERYVRDLCRVDCLKDVSTVVGRRWKLSGRGLRLVAVAHQLSLQSIVEAPLTSNTNGKKVNVVQRGVDGALKHIEHTAGIYSFFASLSQAAQQEQRRTGGHRLLWWELGMTCERRYRDQNTWCILRPDAEATYQAAAHGLRFWLEWDRGTMNVRDLAKKLETYARYVASRAWFRDNAFLPVLLFVVPDPAQELRIARVAKEVLAQTPGLVIRTTTATYLAQRGPLAAIWLQVHPHDPQQRSHMSDSIQQTAPRRSLLGE